MGRRRELAELRRDRRRIATLYLRGKLQTEIAEELGINQSTVSRDLKALQKEWLEDTKIDFDKAKAREIAKIDNLERIYHVAWIRSCEDAETIRKKKAEVAGVERKEIVTTAKGQVGDPRFLTGVQWCIERRCKVLGIDAPTKIAPTDPTGEKEYTGLTDEERNRRICALLGIKPEGEARSDTSDE